MRRRLDVELVRRNLVSSRQEAQRLIVEKVVLVDGVIAEKSARMVAADQNILIQGPKPKYVSRAGQKLEGALQKFNIDPKGYLCLDAGSSTGGFTDCLLQADAEKVIAVDVGTNQLHEKIRDDDRVEVHEQTDIRSFEFKGELCDLVVADLSFISLKLVLEKLKSCLKPNGQIIVLVKPQFEAGRTQVSKGKGVVTDPSIWRSVLTQVASSAVRLDLKPKAITRSSIKGISGNVEFVLWLTWLEELSTGSVSDKAIEAMVDDAIEGSAI